MLKNSFKNQIDNLYYLAWSLTGSIASLLDQTGIPAHRVFSKPALEQFFFFINNPPHHDGKIIIIKSDISEYIKELVVLNSKIISSVDSVVVKSLSVNKKEKNRFSFFKVSNKPSWSDSPSIRFDRVICPVYEEVLCKI